MLSGQLLTQSAPKEIDKTPSCCPSPDHFQAGDILIFNINGTSFLHHTIMAQRLYNNHGGHKEAVHAAFVVEIDGQKKLAHLRSHGFVISEIETIKTVTHVYRPRIYQAEIANQLNQFVQTSQETLKKKLSWNTLMSLRFFSGRLFHGIGIKSGDVEHKKDSSAALPKHEQFISSASVCSKFLAQSYAASCNALTEQADVDVRSLLMNITANTLPKTLQAYLYRCSNYDYYILPHQSTRGKIVENLSEIIENECKRIVNKSDASRAKVQTLRDKLHEFQTNQLEEKFSNDDERIQHDFERAKTLLKMVTPILKSNTGGNVKTPGSYQAVMNYANSQGIYAHYVEKELLFNTRGTDLVSEAKEAYNYSLEFASLYSKYRELGYSDEEARFECEPSFWAWMKMHPRRNIAAAVTVAPLLFWSVPYGLSRVMHAKSRNEQITKEDAHPSLRGA
jgi:hypothetical protein